MKGLCNFADERSGGLFTVKDIIEIDRINAKLKGKPVEGEPPLFTGFFYNFFYGLVNTHRNKYIPRRNICQGEEEGGIFHSGIRIKRMKGEEIGQRIRLLRKALNLTQAEFGEKIGRAWNTINRWEAGEREIPDMALKLISQVFGVSYNWLKTGQGEMWERKVLVKELRKQS